MVDRHAVLSDEEIEHGFRLLAGAQSELDITVAIDRWPVLRSEAFSRALKQSNAPPVLVKTFFYMLHFRAHVHDARAATPQSVSMESSHLRSPTLLVSTYRLGKHLVATRGTTVQSYSRTFKR